MQTCWVNVHLVKEVDIVIRDAVNDFLCGPQGGRRRLATAIAFKSGKPEDFVTEITCKNCLQVHGTSAVVMSSSYQEENADDDLSDIYCLIADIIQVYLRPMMNGTTLWASKVPA